MCLPAVMGELTAFRAKLLDCQKHIKAWASASAAFRCLPDVLCTCTPIIAGVVIVYHLASA